MIVQARGLTKVFGQDQAQIVAVNNVNLTIEIGELVMFMGNSGCGKTTLLRAICGLETLDSGTINLDDVDITNVPAEERGIGLIFQSPVLFPHLSVQGNLLLGDENGDVSTALEEVGLSGFEKRRVESLSGGEGQRVSLARALLAKPKVLLLDEPFSSLDEDLSEKLVQDVRSILKKNDCPAILVTHNKKIAGDFADSVISLSN